MPKQSNGERRDPSGIQIFFRVISGFFLPGALDPPQGKKRAFRPCVALPMALTFYEGKNEDGAGSQFSMKGRFACVVSSSMDYP
jgi:hypothetical protein